MFRFAIAISTAAFLAIATAAPAQTPHFSLWVTEVNGQPCSSCPTQNLPESEVAPGDQLRIDAFLESWDDVPENGMCSGLFNILALMCTGGQIGACTGKTCTHTGLPCAADTDCSPYWCEDARCLPWPQISSYQWTIDSTTFTSGNSGRLSLARIPCDHADCPPPPPGFEGCPCVPFWWSQVSTEVRPDVCESDGYCYKETSALIEKTHPDFIFFGRQTLEAVYTGRPDLEFGAALFDLGPGYFLGNGVADPGHGLRRYIGTLLLDVSTDASGTFTVAMLDDDARTFANDSRGNALLPHTTAPVTINLAAAPPRTPHFSLWVTEVNGRPCPSCPTQNLPETEVARGDRLRVDAYLESWDDVPERGVCSGAAPTFGQPCTVGIDTTCVGYHCANSGLPCVSNAECGAALCVESRCVPWPQVTAYFWTIDSTDFTSGDSGRLMLARIPCNQLDCEYDGECNCTHFSPVPVPQSEIPCRPNGFCYDKTSVFIERERPDYLFLGRRSVENVTIRPPEYLLAAMLWRPEFGVADPGAGERRYVGTLWLDVSADAVGTFVLNIVDYPARTAVFQNLYDPELIPMPHPTMAPVRISLSDPCPGVDCDDHNPCTTDALDLETCNCANMPVDCPPGQVCDPMTGGCETAAACTTIVSSDPPHCEIDARQPHALNDADAVFGLTSLELTFNVACDATTMTPASFAVSTTPGPVSPPAIQSVTAAGNVATLSFDGPIPVENWTCVTHVDSGDSTCFGYLPGDVNRSRAATAADIMALLNSLNNVPGFVRPLFATDINRSGAATAADILRLVDLLNGAHAFDPWLHATLPPCPMQ